MSIVSRGKKNVNSEIFIRFNPRANGTKRHSRRQPEARVTNSARLFTPREKDSIADSKVGFIVGWVVISLISKIWMFSLSGVEEAKKRKPKIVSQIMMQNIFLKK